MPRDPLPRHRQAYAFFQTLMSLAKRAPPGLRTSGLGVPASVSNPWSREYKLSSSRPRKALAVRPGPVLKSSARHPTTAISGCAPPSLSRRPRGERLAFLYKCAGRGGRAAWRLEPGQPAKSWAPRRRLSLSPLENASCSAAASVRHPDDSAARRGHRRPGSAILPRAVPSSSWPTICSGRSAT